MPLQGTGGGGCLDSTALSKGAGSAARAVIMQIINCQTQGSAVPREKLCSWQSKMQSGQAPNFQQAAKAREGRGPGRQRKLLCNEGRREQLPPAQVTSLSSVMPLAWGLCSCAENPRNSKRIPKTQCQGDPRASCQAGEAIPGQLLC